jgi:hypothetical protein
MMPTAPGSPSLPGVSISQLESVVEKIEHGLDDLVNAANAFIQHAESATGWIPIIGDAIKSMLERFKSLVVEFIDKVISVVKQSHAPIVMWHAGQVWSTIGGQAGTVAQALNRLGADSSEWGGIAGGKYSTGVSGQYPAVSAYQSKANAVASACNGTAQAGIGFYIGVAGLIVSCTLAIWSGPIAVIGALASFAWALLNLHAADSTQARNFEIAAQPVGAFDGTSSVGSIGGWPQAVAS